MHNPMQMNLWERFNIFFYPKPQTVFTHVINNYLSWNVYFILTVLLRDNMGAFESGKIKGEREDKHETKPR